MLAQLRVSVVTVLLSRFNYKYRLLDIAYGSIINELKRYDTIDKYT